MIRKKPRTNKTNVDKIASQCPLLLVTELVLYEQEKYDVG